VPADPSAAPLRSPLYVSKFQVSKFPKIGTS
jgi:hypothetical protein